MLNIQRAKFSSNIEARSTEKFTPIQSYFFFSIRLMSHNPYTQSGCLIGYHSYVWAISNWTGVHATGAIRWAQVKRQRHAYVLLRPQSSVFSSIRSRWFSLQFDLGDCVHFNQLIHRFQKRPLEVIRAATFRLPEEIGFIFCTFQSECALPGNQLIQSLPLSELRALLARLCAVRE